MRNSQFLNLATCIMLVLTASSVSRADDSEIYFGGTTSTATGQPNILFVFDTSGSMGTNITSRKDYDPSASYSGTCDKNAVFYQKTSSSTLPNCGTTSKIDKSNFFCKPSLDVLATNGKDIANAIGWSSTTSKKATTWSWKASISNPTAITCEKDTDTSYPLAGSSASSSDLWKGTDKNNYYSAVNAPTFTSYTFYSGNFVNYLNDPTQLNFSGTRLGAVQQASKSLIASLKNANVNVGIMRYSSNGVGGMVIAPLQDAATNADALTTSIDSLTASGTTPLSETLYESYLYYAGKKINFGKASTPTSSVDSSRTSAGSDTYKSPITNSCQKNYVVFLTDGLANSDYRADSQIESLDNTYTGCYSSDTAMWTSLGQKVPTETHSGGLCLRELSAQMNTKDLSPLGETQTVSTYFIGFGDDVQGGAPQAYLQDAAKAGGGAAEVATDPDTLLIAFDKTIGNVLEASATFATPSIAVNAFNQTQVLEDLYIAMFKPAKTTHWDGNLKKFKLRDGKIVGRGSTLTSVATESAIDDTSGFLKQSAKDFWEQLDETDTNITTKGGAANMLPDPNNSDPKLRRNVYTYLGKNIPGSMQKLASSPFDTSNTALTDSVMGTGTSTSSCGTDCQYVINYMRGDSNGDGKNSDIRHIMGDPVHSQPVVVIYGNSATATTTIDKLNDAVVYVPTNDGFLHAVDVNTGTELWSYIPKELLSDLTNVADTTEDAQSKHYSLDGDIKVLKYDINGDGAIDAATDGSGDRVILYFSQGRGGDNYYAIDVTYKDNPQFMWSLDNTQLPKVNKSWSTPVLTRIAVQGASQNSQKLVLVFGGGYDDSEDAQGFLKQDNYGNAIYMVDAISGALLWSASDAGANLSLVNMTHAIPSSIGVVDTNNDGFADRMYVGDMAGQLWRFDITNGKTPDALVAGGVIASLGEKGESSPTIGDILNNRSFYNIPDVVYMTTSGANNYYAVSIGSGDRGLPKSNITTRDFFFNVRDYYTRQLTQAEFNSLKPIKVGDLTTIGNSATGPTALPKDPLGWKIELSPTEKSLSAATTVEGVTLFTTYLPAATACNPLTGTGRSYAVNTKDGSAKFSTMYESFTTTGIPSYVSLVNNSRIVKTMPDSPSSSSSSSSSCSSGQQCETPPSDCLAGGTHLTNECPRVGNRYKTFWQDSGAP